jgi:hypothetical protein
MTKQNIDNLCNILKNIKEQAKNENLRLTQHGQQEIAKEDVKLSDLFEAIATSEILENYPEHQRGSCCLIYGTTKSGKNLHIVCTTSLTTLIVITAYIPKPPKWITSTQRRKIQ